MKPLTCIFYVIILLFNYTTTIAQSNISKELINLNVDDGLSNPRVHSIFKDREGFIWLGTKNGLNRFDGTNFKVYQNEPNNPESIANGYINDIKQDTDGSIWMAIDGGGVNILNPITDKITKLFKGQKFIQNRLQYAKEIVIDKDVVWIATWGGLIRYYKKNKTYQVFKNKKGKKSINSTDIKCIIGKGNKYLWIGSDIGISRLNKETLEFENNIKDSEGNTIQIQPVRTLFLDSKDNLWVGIRGGLYQYNLKTLELKQQILNHNDVESNVINKIYEDPNSDMWICTDNGVFSLSNNFSSILPDHNILEYNPTYCLYKDSDERLIVGTFSEGIYIFYPEQKAIQTLLPKNFSNCTRIGSIIKGDDNSIWYSTYGCGLFEYNLTTKIHTPYCQDSELTKITQLHKDGKRGMWIGTRLDGLYYYNFIKEEHQQLIANLYILSLFEYFNNTLWIATEKGLRFIDKKTKAAIAPPYLDQIPEELLTDFILFIKEDRDKNIWISSLQNGVFVLNQNLKIIKRYKFENNDNNYISFHEDIETDSYYLGTDYGGILKINKDGTSQNITTEEGLPGNTVTSIISDNNNNIWVSGTKGIGLIKNTNPNTFLSFDAKDGVDSYQFFPNSVHKDENGLIYFGGSNGISYFNPNKIFIKQNTQKTIIHDLYIYNQKLVTDTVIAQKKEVILDYRQNFLKFNFTNLEFTPYENYTYKYQLEGIDNNWNTSHNSSSASYTNMPPGKYTFKVTSVNKFGIWNDTPAKLNIYIHPPFWKTWWFYGLSATFILLSIIGIIKSREKKIISEKEIAQFKLQALRSQMNPHFIFNSLNSIQHFIIKNESRFALDYLSKFSKLVRKILDNSVSNKITISEEVIFLQNYIEIESLRFDRKITFDIDLTNCSDCSNTEIPSMLIQPFIENSIIHGLMNLDNEVDAKIAISFKLQKNTIQCSILDNGIGRKASMEIKNRIKQKHKSFGLSITKNRLDTLNKLNFSSISATIEDLTNAKGIGCGTKVIIHIPID